MSRPLRTVADWRSTLRAHLREALGARRPHVVAVLRETLAAIDNAEAPPAVDLAVNDAAFAGSVPGLGAAEVPRIALTPEAVDAIIAREIRERRAASAELSALGRHDEANVLSAQADILDALVAPPAINRGDIFWLAPDVPGPSHPHVVVQDDVFNHARIATVVVCALTTNLTRAKEPGNVLLDPGEGDLPKQSVVVVSQIDSVEKARLGARIGTLSEARVDEILAGLRFLQRAFFR